MSFVKTLLHVHSVNRFQGEFIRVLQVEWGDRRPQQLTKTFHFFFLSQPISGSGHSDSYSLDSAAEQAADTETEITGNQKETGIMWC